MTDESSLQKPKRLKEHVKKIIDDDDEGEFVRDGDAKLNVDHLRGKELDDKGKPPEVQINHKLIRRFFMSLCCFFSTQFN